MKEVVIVAINQLPAIIAALASLSAVLLGLINRKTVVAAAGDAQKAAQKADVAAIRADETHEVTRSIAMNTEKVAEQTNGHLTRLTTEVTSLSAENVTLQKTIATLVNILTAQRVAAASADQKGSIVVPALRSKDLEQAVSTLTKLETESEPKRREDDT